MPKVLVDERDVKFVLWEHLGAQKILEFDRFQGYSEEDFNMIISEARKFAEEVIMPINKEGDELGLKVEEGQVKVPDCYKQAYDAFCEAGWIAMAAPEEWGGQNLPALMSIAATEAFVAASVAFSMYPGLTEAAARLIETYGTEEQKKKYLPKLISGKWQGTMDLTEPQAGSAVGYIKTTAKQKDGKWYITGNKIFISCGDHDMVENIIHLVLARAEGSPPGTKGLSLFIVPKYRVNDDGSLGEFNDITLGRIEEKMGIHASPTCLLNFGDNGNCIGELVGEINQGIKYMFLMMNEARIGVGVQGEAVASAAYLSALQYAKERLQSPPIEKMKDPTAPQVEIIKHPDVRRMLLWMKAYVEGMRAMIYRGVYYWTLSEYEPNAEEREKYADFLALLTPIIKAYCSDMGFLIAKEALQVYGGYGYTREYPVEQYVRDVKIASIYEGTNGIQALDLVGRKVLNVKKQMKPYNDFIAMIRDYVNKQKAHPKFGKYAEKVAKAVDALDECTQVLVKAGLSGDMSYPVLVATPYLKVFGDMILGWIWLEQMVVADEKLDKIFEEKGASDDAKKKEIIDSYNEAAFYAGKIHTGRFYIDCLLPEVFAGLEYIKSNNRDVLEIPEHAF